MVNTFYILRKQLGIEAAKTALRKLRMIVHIIDSILTRNIKDYRSASLLVQSPGVFLAANKYI